MRGIKRGSAVFCTLQGGRSAAKHSCCTESADIGKACVDVPRRDHTAESAAAPAASEAGCHAPLLPCAKGLPPSRLHFPVSHRPAARSPVESMIKAPDAADASCIHEIQVTLHPTARASAASPRASRTALSTPDPPTTLRSHDLLPSWCLRAASRG